MAQLSQLKKGIYRGSGSHKASCRSCVRSKPRSFAILTCILLFIAAPCLGDEGIYFDIPPSSAGEALTLFAQQADIQLIFPYSLVADIRVEGITGKFTPDQALQKLVDGMCLQSEFSADNTITLNPKKRGFWFMKRKTNCLAAALMVGSTLANAQPAPSGASLLEEVIVTAQRRSESLQQVPIAASALSGESMTMRGMNDVRDLADGLVPSLRIDSPYGNTNPKLTMRGVGSTSYTQNTETSVAIYLDELVLNPQSSKLGQMFDLERVEVLRGPQGTLYGKNSTGGAINFISRRPTGEYGVSVTSTVARFGEYSFEVTGEAPINDNWSLRTAVKKRHRDGYGFNRLTEEKIYDVDDLAGRIGLRYQNDSIDAYFKLFGDRSRGQGYYFRGVGINPDLSPRPGNDNPITGYAPPKDIDVVDSSRQTNDVDNWGVTANIDIGFEAFTLTSVTGYLDSEAHIFSDSDASPFDLLTADIVAPAEEFYQELRITSNTGSRLSWIAGLSAFHQTLEMWQDTSFSAAGLPPNDLYYKEKSTSFAVFLDGTLEAGEDLTLFAGIRLTTDKKKFDTSAQASFIGPYDREMSERWTEPSYRIGVNKEINPDVMLWASYNRGYRAGGFDGGLIASPHQFKPFDPEFADSYEVGVKASAFDRRLRFAANTYYTIVKDQQLPVLAEGAALCCSIVNAGRSRIYGLELEGSAQLAENFDIQFQGSVSDGEFTDFRSGTDDYSGMRVSNLPRYEVRLSTEYRIPVAEGEVFIAPEVVFVGKTRRGTDFDPYGRDIMGSYELVNGQMGYRSGTDRLAVWLFVKNLTDKRYLTDYLNIGGFGLTQYLYAEPRTWGVTMAVKF